MLLGFSTGAFNKFVNPISKEAILLCKKIGCNAVELGCGEGRERVYLLKNITKRDLQIFK